MWGWCDGTCMARQSSIPIHVHLPELLLTTIPTSFQNCVYLWHLNSNYIIKCLKFLENVISKMLLLYNLTAMLYWQGNLTGQWSTTLVIHSLEDGCSKNKITDKTESAILSLSIFPVPFSYPSRLIHNLNVLILKFVW